MKQLPRLSGALRAFSDVGFSTQDYPTATELVKKRQHIAKSKSEGLTWETLSAKLHKQANIDKTELTKTLKELSQCAKNIGLFSFH